MTPDEAFGHDSIPTWVSTSVVLRQQATRNRECPAHVGPRIMAHSLYVRRGRSKVVTRTHVLLQ